MIRINLWSSPRNISTALMYSFAQRSDTTVVDEPLYAYYLANTDSEAEHPGVPAIMASQSAEGEAVVRDIILGEQYNKEVVVFKQMTHHLLTLDRSFLGRTKNVLLIRDPRAILNSYSKVVNNPSPFDIGIPQQDALYEQLRAAGSLAAIVEASNLLRNPTSVLKQLCSALAIPFSDQMLRWAAGPLPEDGVWAPYWYHNVHQSTGFKPYVEREITLSPALEVVAEVCLPAYERLLADSKCIKP